MELDHALLDRAEYACRILDAASKYQLSEHGYLDFIDRDNAQAYLCLEDGLFRIVILGTGHKRESSLGSESVDDWRYNIRALLPVVWRGMFPKLGESQRYRWPLGFLDRADVIWGEAKSKGWFDCPFHLYGHSQGGAVTEIIAWTIEYRRTQGIEDIPLAEAHAIAPARSCFSKLPASRLCHSWLGYDDPVCWVPPGARHVGIAHWLPRMSGKLGERHSALGYLKRLKGERARLDVLKAAKVLRGVSDVTHGDFGRVIGLRWP